MSLKLRNYQVDAVHAAMDFIRAKNGRKAVIIAPTGAGKSLLISKVADLIDSPVLVLQPSKELLLQNLSKLEAFGGKASVYSASLNQSEIGHITYATPRSIVKEISKLKTLGVKNILVDEAHYNCRTGSTISQIIRGLGDNTKVIGFTATPVLLANSMSGAILKMLNRTKDSIFSDIIHCTQIQELVKNKFWSDLNYEVYKQSNDTLKLNSNGSDFTDSSLKNYYFENNLTEQVVKTYEKIKTERKSILIFAPDITSAKELQTKLKGSEVVHSNLPTKERDRIIDGFKDGSIQTVININILAIGFDKPDLSAVINTRPTNSIAVYYQQLGRGCRVHPEKKDCLIVDFSGNCERFGKLEDLTFENIDGYGWGMFSRDHLLSGVPMGLPKPTKIELLSEIKDVEDITFAWGKHKNKRISEVVKTDSQYLIWMLNNPEWDWSRRDNKKLKVSIEIQLKQLIQNGKA